MTFYRGLLLSVTLQGNNQCKVMTESDDSGSANGSITSKFSKAQFTVGEAAIDVDDEEFWEKVLPAERSVSSLAEKLKDPTALSTAEQR
jgi:hypothetical protein